MKYHLRHRGRAACGYEGDRLTRFPSRVSCCDCRRSVVMAVREIEQLNQPRHLRMA